MEALKEALYGVGGSSVDPAREIAHIRGFVRSPSSDNNGQPVCPPIAEEFYQ